MSRALVLAGSDVTATRALRALCAEADHVIAADSGVRHAAALGVTPDLIVGDFDSVAQKELERYPAVPRRTYPARKDALDLELALGEGLERGATRFLIVGALGGRLDQTLAALLIASRLHARYPVTLHSGHTAAYPLRAKEVRSLELPAETTFSLLSLSETSTVSLENASYPLRRSVMPFGVGRGVSNTVARAPLTVSLHEGSALLIVTLS